MSLRWTKAALAVFGLGLALGFIAVVLGAMPRLERAASATMAIGLVLLPAALLADGRGLAWVAWVARLLSGRSAARAPARSPRGSRAPRRKPARKPASRSRRKRG